MKRVTNILFILLIVIGILLILWSLLPQTWQLDIFKEPFTGSWYACFNAKCTEIFP